MSPATPEARRLADAVLFEGHSLYPYRPSAAKNRYRWQWGVVGPREWGALLGPESEPIGFECLLTGDDPRVTLVVRFLVVEDPGPEPGRELVRAGEVPIGPLALRALQSEPIEERFADDAAIELEGAIAIATRDAGWGWALTVEIENTTSAGPPPGTRPEAMAASFLGVHAIAEVVGGSFLSAIDPPEAARGAAGALTCRPLWPVLVGDPDGADTLLAAPIILDDFPAVADQSAGDAFDATEIEELLTLRIRTLADEERDEILAGDDPRAADLLGRAEALAPVDLARLHGTWRPAVGSRRAGPGEPGNGSVMVGGREVRRGSPVVLRPGRSADAHDLFLAGRLAQVAGVFTDVDGRTHVAVTLMDDPAADLLDEVGRYRYFGPDEIEPR